MARSKRNGVDMDDDEKDRILNTVRYIGSRAIYMGRKGEPLTLAEWAERSENLEYRRVSYDELPETSVNPASYVSTVWLGIDQSFGLIDHPPILFETMRFAIEAKPMTWPDGHVSQYHPALEFPDPEGDGTTERMQYYTEEQAHITHRAIVRLIQEKEMS